MVTGSAGVVSSQHGKLDVAYVERWVTNLHLEEQWEAVSGAP